MSLIPFGGVLLAVSLVAQQAPSALATPIADLRDAALRVEAQGQVQEALRAWSLVLQQDGSNAEALAHLGLLEARQQQYAEAIRFDLRALQGEPEMPGLRLNLGLAYFKSGQLGAALSPLSEELRLHTDSAQLLILLGLAHAGIGDDLAAIPYLERAEAESPSLELKLALMRSCLLSGQFLCVEKAYNTLVALHATGGEAELLIGIAKLQTGAAAEAAPHLHRAAGSHTAGAHLALGYLAWTAGRWSEAEDEFAAESPKNSAAATWEATLRGDCAVKLQRWPEAKVQLQAAQEAEPGFALLHQDLAALETHEGDPAGAEVEQRLAARLRPDAASDLVLQLAPLLRQVTVGK